MYSRQVIPHRVRQLITISALTVLERSEELEMHIYAALNVGCTPGEIAEVIFQTSIYGGFPAMNNGLKVLKKVLEEKGMWPMKGEAERD
jgi:4-carboxymuconolactone decarboxylase